MSRTEWLIEETGQYCLSCRQDKKGRFLLIFIESSDVHEHKKLFVAICEDCIKMQPYDKNDHLKMARKMGFYSDEVLKIYNCVYSPEDLPERGKLRDKKPLDRRVFKR